MGLDDIAKLFQIRHLVPDRSRTQIQIRVLGNRPASHRLSRFQVVPDDRMQDLHFPLIQFSFHLTVTPFRVVSTQPIRVLTPSDTYIITSPTRCQRIFYFFYKPRSHPEKYRPGSRLRILRPVLFGMNMWRQPHSERPQALSLRGVPPAQIPCQPRSEGQRPRASAAFTP